MNRPTTLGMRPSFGFGDRLGLATPGHVRAMLQSGSGIEPIFPQQSIREMTRTARTPETVMTDALDGMRRAGWTGATGADADHLKTTADVDATVAAGFTFFTIDPSEHVDPKADIYDAATLRDRFDSLDGAVDWPDRYRGKSVRLPTGTEIIFDDTVCIRAAVKYGRAVAHSCVIADHLRSVCEGRNQDYEIELSVDETDQPTTLAEHFLVADRCLDHGMKLVSLAPRLIGDFEKGVDYKGDVAALERSLKDHAAIATVLGPYKLSLHSGSDKLSIYPALARATRGKFHVKTAGTSYLEALRVVAHHEPTLFRRIIDFARERYDRDKATYHVAATLATVPAPSAITDPLHLERVYLELWHEVEPGRGFTHPGRQILHCTFGSVLTDAELGPALRGVVESHHEAYGEILADHFGRHLDALRAGMEG